MGRITFCLNLPFFLVKKKKKTDIIDHHCATLLLYGDYSVHLLLSIDDFLIKVYDEVYSRALLFLLLFFF